MIPLFMLYFIAAIWWSCDPTGVHPADYPGDHGTTDMAGKNKGGTKPLPEPMLTQIYVTISVWYKKKFGSQNFGYQIWFCTRLHIDGSVQEKHKSIAGVTSFLH